MLQLDLKRNKDLIRIQGNTESTTELEVLVWPI